MCPYLYLYRQQCGSKQRRQQTPAKLVSCSPSCVMLSEVLFLLIIHCINRVSTGCMQTQLTTPALRRSCCSML
jgi:hypothetical protein